MKNTPQKHNHHFRFHLPFAHVFQFWRRLVCFKKLKPLQGFGTPFFLVAQTLVVVVWIALNIMGSCNSICPFILLNLAFSLQAAYAAPLILLAQTRQADRDKAHAEADALHREAIAAISEERALLISQQSAQLLEFMEQNTQLTEVTKALSERIESLTREIHSMFVCEAQ